jgi:hypothetical protein
MIVNIFLRKAKEGVMAGRDTPFDSSKGIEFDEIRVVLSISFIEIVCPPFSGGEDSLCDCRMESYRLVRVLFIWVVKKRVN